MEGLLLTAPSPPSCFVNEYLGLGELPHCGTPFPLWTCPLEHLKLYGTPKNVEHASKQKKKKIIIYVYFSKDHNKRKEEEKSESANFVTDS